MPWFSCGAQGGTLFSWNSNGGLFKWIHFFSLRLFLFFHSVAFCVLFCRPMTNWTFALAMSPQGASQCRSSWHSGPSHGTSNPRPVDHLKWPQALQFWSVLVEIISPASNYPTFFHHFFTSLRCNAVLEKQTSFGFSSTEKDSGSEIQSLTICRTIRFVLCFLVLFALVVRSDVPSTDALLLLVVFRASPTQKPKLWMWPSHGKVFDISLRKKTKCSTTASKQLYQMKSM